MRGVDFKFELRSVTDSVDCNKMKCRVRGSDAVGRYCHFTKLFVILFQVPPSSKITLAENQITDDSQEECRESKVQEQQQTQQQFRIEI